MAPVVFHCYKYTVANNCLHWLGYVNLLLQFLALLGSWYQDLISNVIGFCCHGDFHGKQETFIHSFGTYSYVVSALCMSMIVAFCAALTRFSFYNLPEAVQNLFTS